MNLRGIFFTLVTLIVTFGAFGQEVPILHYSTNNFGQVQLRITSEPSKYYILKVRNSIDSAFTLNASMTYGQEGTTVVSEALKAYPLEHYRVEGFDINTSVDCDEDGLNDISDYNGMPLNGPFNAAISLPSEHGLSTLNNITAFNLISTNENLTPWVEYLNGMQYTKFLIDDFYSDHPKIYFINSNTYALHVDFANYLGIDHLSPDIKKGQLIFHPNVISNNGTLGTYTFNFSNNEAQDFQIVQRTHELLAANMLFLKNNLSYFITENNEQDYFNNQVKYNNSRVSIVFESNVFQGINYLAMNRKEAFGFFRKMNFGEIPGAREIVLYDYLPNTLPRVGGVITSVMQTPLSHVNLRAIHDNIPNAFVRNPMDNPEINGLLGHYVYFKTNQSGFEIREATLDEVNTWYDSIRPNFEVKPPLNLTYTEIVPLDSISFQMFDGFGAKTTNVATMRTFGFPDKTIPDGYGVPFFFYQEFIKKNGLFEEIKGIISAPEFISNREFREQQLSLIRSKIKAAPMPDWMLEKLTRMQSSFPAGSSIRCRSSSNNEDLPGFNGAGLYDSKTQHPNEGHISKSIKQVYASLWNLRAFEEREFFRVDHFKAAMGVLVHLNFEDELVNGVAISSDPIYGTQNHFYVNSQLGEELITNPTNSFPEELLLSAEASSSYLYSVVNYSSLVNVNTLLMSYDQLEKLRDYLYVIHDRFSNLYKASSNSSFAMDVEFKVDHEGNLVIKQARPWVSFIPENEIQNQLSELKLFPNPVQSRLFIDLRGDVSWKIFDLLGNVVLSGKNDGYPFSIELDNLANSTYILSLSINEKVLQKRFIKL